MERASYKRGNGNNISLVVGILQRVVRVSDA